ncbi:hypothetical protein QVD17_04838 [Tagetes erecta]|uniref:Late embryogenesis abundant protein, LEA-18 n=1 Tax=Tagetes erecta TaxID=13708 RepID=A0AAD8PA23_TARER|nr:hypothetical protein QVD17_04838 [Tagetes erecta]
MDGQQPKKQEEEKVEDLPVQKSPYTQYKDLEDYKMQGYGTQGHQKPEPGRGASASTDAPTTTGDTVFSKSNKGSDTASATATVNKHGVP